MLKRRLRGGRALAVAALALAAFPAGASAAGGRHALAGNTAPYARPSQDGGAVPNARSVAFSVYLNWRNAGDLASFTQAVSDPTSSAYGHYLTPAQFRARYAPTDAQVRQVTKFLRSYGLRIGEIPANRHYVAASGNVADAERAFAVAIRYYRFQGHKVQAPSSSPSVPDALSSVVDGVSGLDTGAKAHPDRADGNSRRIAGPKAPPAPAFVNAPPCSNYWGQKTATGTPPAYGQVQPYVPCGYGPQQLQGAYGVNGAISAGVNGRGQTVAIVDAFASPTIQQDVATYSGRHGLPRPHINEVVPPGLYNAPETDTSDPQGWYGEETLDLEAVHSMAPGANMVYVGGKDDSAQALDHAVNKVVDRHLAQIVTNSYGDLGETEPPRIVLAENLTYLQAIAEGIGVYFSSGDDGDDVIDFGTPAVEQPTSFPDVTAVGGTTLAVGAQNQRLFETGWGTKKSSLDAGAWSPTPPGTDPPADDTTFLYGSGGGTSQIWPEPFYQRGVVPASLANHYGSPHRVVPDVAMDGDPNSGFLEGQTQTFPDGSVKYGEYRIGGTSLSSPLFAGLMALADQYAGRPHGFVNPLLYARARSGAFHDVTDPPGTIAVVRNDFVNGVDAGDGIGTSLRTANQTGTLHTTPGYDDVTGVGTPNGVAFLNALR